MGLRAAGTQQERAESYFKVPSSLYRPGDMIEEDLFFLYQGQFVLYRLKNLVWKIEDEKRLVEFQMTDLYMRFKDKRDHQKFLESNLSKILDSKMIPEVKKAEILYESSISLAEAIFSSPKSAETLKRSMKSIKNTIHFLSKDRSNFFGLMSMASKDFSEFSHAVNTAAYSISLANQMGIKNFNQISCVGIAAMLHDLGKSKVDKAILEKPGKLTDEERMEVEKHPRYSYEIVHESRSIPDISELIVLQHHERPKGRGYPSNMNDDIHVFTKIVALSDCFDSLTSDRNYQSAIKPVNAIELLRMELKEDYDQDLVVEFIKMLKR